MLDQNLLEALDDVRAKCNRATIGYQDAMRIIKSHFEPYDKTDIIQPKEKFGETEYIE